MTVCNDMKRNENMDLLRIVSIYFVVCIHYIGWGGLAGAGNVPMANFAIGGAMAVACNCAVNIFYMISGYFIKPEEKIQTCKKRVLKVWVPTFIYSISIPMFLQLIGEIDLNIKQLVFLFLPVMSNQYWFSTCFIAVTMLLPFIANLLADLDKKNLLTLVGVLVFWDCIQPILGINAFGNIGYGILHAVTMYVIGYTIRKLNIKLKSIYCILIFLACVGLIGMITIISIKFTNDRNRTIADYNSIIMVIQSCSFFLFFQNLSIRKIHFSKLSPYVFGVYLLNDNNYARDFLWHKVLHCQDFYRSTFLPLHLISVTILFVMIAMLIEFIRINCWKFLTCRLKGNHNG